MSEPTTPDEFAKVACAATNSTFSGRIGDTSSLGYEIDTDASNFAAWAFAHSGDVFDYTGGTVTPFFFFLFLCLSFRSFLSLFLCLFLCSTASSIQPILRNGGKKEGEVNKL